ncbi:PIN domain-containing protein [Demequina sp. SO4-18]|uniref:PIN domain-containing protein n=1 Tax=Demequina sp. SO4-18 TaxID=3401026 RepID=UPI003B59B0C6
MFTRVLVDANVLVSRTLRDWILLLQINAPGMFATCWTEDILAETVYGIRRRNRHADGEVITRIADRLRATMSERIEGFAVKPFPALTDANDLHVHAAALAGGVNMLLTDDSDFLHLPPQVLDELPYEVIDADSFLVLVDDSSPTSVSEVMHQQWTYWRSKDPSTDLPQRLRDAGCPQFAERLWRHQHADL